MLPGAEAKAPVLLAVLRRRWSMLSGACAACGGGCTSILGVFGLDEHIGSPIGLCVGIVLLLLHVMHTGQANVGPQRGVAQG